MQLDKIASQAAVHSSLEAITRVRKHIKSNCQAKSIVKSIGNAQI